MKKNNLHVVISALALILGFLVIGCDTGTGGGGGESLDSALVAKWHSTQAAADSGDSVVFEITSDGKITGEAFTVEMKVTTSGGSISATLVSNGTEVGSANYVVEGKTLKFSSQGASGQGIFASLIAGQDFSLAAGGDGKYHKK